MATKYIKKFETEASYDAYMGGDPYLPNVSYIEELELCFFRKKDYSTEYLTFEVLSNGTICQSIDSGGGDEPILAATNPNTRGGDYILGAGNDEPYMEYSIDGGETWDDMPAELNVSAGDEVMVRGNVCLRQFINDVEVGPILAATKPEGDVVAGAGETRGASGHFSFAGTSCSFNLKGNIMSIVAGENFRSANSMEDATFQNIFDYLGVVDASRLSLPATTLSTSCYSYMFNGCSNMTAGPTTLPAMELAESCYAYMFNGCSNMTVGPTILPAMELADSCYSGMFAACESLTRAPELPATNLPNYAYNSMFSYCISLRTAPTINATTLGEYSCSSMFSDCTSLTSVQSSLPAMTLGYNCYSGMFQNCSNLTTAPELPATGLSTCCYDHMFYYCTSLVNAPSILPATTQQVGNISATQFYQRMFAYCTSLQRAPEILMEDLDDGNGYQGDCREMFKGCSSLNYVKCLAKTISTNCFKNWLSGVSSTGTFICYYRGPYGALNWPRTADGIPSNWTVEYLTYVA